MKLAGLMEILYNNSKNYQDSKEAFTQDLLSAAGEEDVLNIKNSTIRQWYSRSAFPKKNLKKILNGKQQHEQTLLSWIDDQINVQNAFQEICQKESPMLLNDEIYANNSYLKLLLLKDCFYHFALAEQQNLILPFPYYDKDNFFIKLRNFSSQYADKTDFVQTVPFTDKEQQPVLLPVYVKQNMLPVQKILCTSSKNNIFLTGAGGMGKSVALQQYFQSYRHHNETCFYLPLSKYQTVPAGESRETTDWILIYILMKYILSDVYDSFSDLSSKERSYLRNLREEFEKMPAQDESRQYVVLLDGYNESDFHCRDSLNEELNHAFACWKNVHFVISSRTVPDAKELDSESFLKYEIHGLSDETIQCCISDINLTGDADFFHLLHIPMFLAIYNQLPEERRKKNSTKGELIEQFFHQYEHQKFNKDSSIQFVIDFIFPAVAWEMTQKEQMQISYQNCAQKFNDIFRIFVSDAKVYDSYTHIFYQKQPVQQETSYLLNQLTESLCICRIDTKTDMFYFSHQLYRDYFAAKYIEYSLSASKAIYSDYRQRREFLWNQQKINSVWLPEICQLLGEICKDYQNLPDCQRNFSYHRTCLDFYLDIIRGLDFDNPDYITALRNLLDTFVVSRNQCLCGIDFSDIDFAPVNLSGKSFSLDGKYPSRFDGSKLYLVNFWNPVYCMAYANEKHLIALGGEGFVSLYHAETRKLLSFSKIENISTDVFVRNMCFFCHDNYLVISTLDSVSVWTDLETSKPNMLYHFSLDGFSLPILTIVMQKYLLVGTVQKIQFLNPETLEHKISDENEDVRRCFTCLASAYHAPYYAIGTANGRVIIKNIKNGRIKNERSFPDTICHIFFSKDDKKCIILTKTQITEWNYTENDIPCSFPNPIIKITSALVTEPKQFHSPDNSYWLIPDKNSTTFTAIHPSDTILLPVKTNYAVFSSDNQYFAIASDEKILICQITETDSKPDIYEISSHPCKGLTTPSGLPSLVFDEEHMSFYAIENNMMQRIVKYDINQKKWEPYLSNKELHIQMKKCDCSNIHANDAVKGLLYELGARL